MFIVSAFVIAVAVQVGVYKLWNSYRRRSVLMQFRADRVATRAKLDGTYIGINR